MTTPPITFTHSRIHSSTHCYRYLYAMSTPVLLNSFLENAWEWLRYLDTRLFLKINTEWTSSFLDSVFPWYREANAWVPLYLFLIVFAFMNFKQKAIPWILFAVLTATLTDQISSSLIKNWIARPRPCRDELFMSQVRLILNNCSGGLQFSLFACHQSFRVCYVPFSDAEADPEAMGMAVLCLGGHHLLRPGIRRGALPA